MKNKDEITSETANTSSTGSTTPKEKNELKEKLEEYVLAKNELGKISDVILDDIPFLKRFASKQTREEAQTQLLKSLQKANIDPLIFDKLLTTEVDRKLKIKYGNRFLWLTTIFTAVSYAIVILNAKYEWKISDVAITALIIETPIQFIGLLYIIARNLFPQFDPKQKD